VDKKIGEVRGKAGRGKGDGKGRKGGR